MAESTLSLGYDDLQRDIGGIVAGFGDDSASWTAAQVAIVDRCIQAGLRKFYYPQDIIPPGYIWSFLRTSYDLTFVADQMTYDLPDNFLRIDDPTINYTTDGLSRPIIQTITEGKFRSLEQNYPDESGYPEVAIIRTKTHAPTTGQRHTISFWPLPESTYEVRIYYVLQPDKLTSANKYPHGGGSHFETIRALCLEEACLQFREIGLFQVWRDEAMRRLGWSVRHDQSLGMPMVFGRNDNSGGQMPAGAECRSNRYVAHNGVRIE